MLAALIATRPVGPVQRFLYTNQFIAATNVFVCITVCRRAAYICTDRTIQTTLSLSLPGKQSFLEQLNQYYYRIINTLASEANMIPLPTDLYLSNQIAAAIVSATALTGILATLPVAVANRLFLVRLQNDLALALANLKALGQPF